MFVDSSTGFVVMIGCADSIMVVVGSGCIVVMDWKLVIGVAGTRVILDVVDAAMIVEEGVVVAGWPA
jgi:hypothetical protein